MDAIVALALVLIGFALGGVLVYIALRRAHAAEMRAVNGRLDDFARALSMAGAEDGNARDTLDVSTAQMAAFRPGNAPGTGGAEPARPLAALRIPGGTPVGWGGSQDDGSMPGSLVAPPIPGMTPPHEAPSPHEAMTHPPHTGPVPVVAQSAATIPPVVSFPHDPLAPVSVVVPHAARHTGSAVAAQLPPHGTLPPHALSATHVPGAASQAPHAGAGSQAAPGLAAIGRDAAAREIAAAREAAAREAREAAAPHPARDVTLSPHGSSSRDAAPHAARDPAAHGGHSAREPGPHVGHGTGSLAAQSPLAHASAALPAAGAAVLSDRTLPPGSQAPVASQPSPAPHSPPRGSHVSSLPAIGGAPSVHRSVPPARPQPTSSSMASGMLGPAPASGFERKSALPAPRPRSMEAMAPPAAPLGASAPPAEAATMLEQELSSFDAPAEPSKLPRRADHRNESREIRTEPRVEAPELPRFPSTPLAPRPPQRGGDPTMPMALEPPLPPTSRVRRDDDEVTQLDPLEPELMARLQAPPSRDRATIPPISTSAEKSGPRRTFEEPALPARVTANGGVLRGRDANTNVLHVEEAAWPDVAGAGAGGGWELDNLLGDFARDLEGTDPPAGGRRKG